jgi:hypothetical protein
VRRDKLAVAADRVAPDTAGTPLVCRPRTSAVLAEHKRGVIRGQGNAARRLTMKSTFGHQGWDMGDRATKMKELFHSIASNQQGDEFMHQAPRSAVCVISA